MWESSLRLGIWRRCALGRNPEFNFKLITLRTDERNDATLIETARVDQVINDATGMLLYLTAFAGFAGINNDVSSGFWIVLQLDSEIVEPCFLVVARDVRKFVEPAAGQFWSRELDRAVSGALEVVTAE